jgi:RNA polymerase II subunit A small phosphatase-like protein
VLDLDETLVHSQFKPVENADIILPVEIEGQICQIYILVRPGVTSFLQRMSKHYEMVVFTASLSKYAEPLVAQLDPEGFCSYKLFREHCTFYNNAFVKDLTRLGRPMTDVIIVDNSPIAYMFQPENAIPCISWYDDMADTDLDRIASLLERLAYEEDIRKIIRKVIKNNALDDTALHLYLQAQKRDHSQKNPESRKGYQAVTNQEDQR